MIAVHRAIWPAEVARESRRRLGGRALAVSEYAARLSGLVTKLLEMSSKHGFWTSTTPLSSDDYDEMLRLDGSIEALRIRLGITPIPPKEYNEPLGGKYVGFSRILIIYHKTSPDDLLAPTETYIEMDFDWEDRMKSLKAIADELATAPELDPEESDIVSLIVETNKRMTTNEILSAFEQRGVIKGESTIKGKLAQLTRRRILVNRSDTSPKGYGLPEWQ